MQNSDDKNIIIPYETTDGVKSHVSIFKADAAENAPVVMLMPAMGVGASYYASFAETLNLRGIHATTADLRGIGASSVRASQKHDFGYYEMAALEWPAIIGVVRQTFPDSPLYLLGHSLGGQISALYLALHWNNPLVSGYIIVAAGNVYYKGWDFPRSLGILFFTQLCRVLVAFTDHFPGKRLGFGGREAKSVIRDWSRQARTGRFLVRNRELDLADGLSKVKVPILATTIEDDWLCPWGSTDNLLKQMTSADIERWTFDPDAHGLSGVNHFTWVRKGGPLADRIRTWLKKNM